MKVQFFVPPSFHYTGLWFRMLPTIGMPTLVAWLNMNGIYAEGADLEALAVTPEAFRNAWTAQRHRWPDAVGVGGLSVQRRGMREIIQAARDAGYDGYIVAGGVHATVKPEEVLSYGVDCVVTGECEGNIVRILTERPRGVVRGEPAPIEDIPPADWTHWTPEITTYFGNVRSFLGDRPGIDMWARGCPAACIFCGNPVFGRRPTRYRPPWSIEQSMAKLRELGVKRANIYDDELVGLKQPDNWMDDIAARIGDLGIEWMCQGRCSRKFVTEQTMRAMYRAGCRLICWGVESFSQPVLDAMKKGIRVEDIEHSLAVARGVGIENGVFLMIGNYQETDRDREVSVRHLARLHSKGLVQMRQVTVLTPMEGTELARIAREEGWFFEMPEYGGNAYQMGETPWMPADRAQYWLKRFEEACPRLMV